MSNDIARQEKKGIRCTVCTGCGRCPGVGQMHILTGETKHGVADFPKDEVRGAGGDSRNNGARRTTADSWNSRAQRRAIDLRSDSQEWLITADVGTTTIAMQLHNSDGSVVDTYVAVNPQTEYGADVLSRITAAKEAEQAKEMREMVLAVLERGVARFRSKIDANRKTENGQVSEVKMRMVLAANTTMVYLLMGWNPEELGRAPFTASHLEGAWLQIASIPCYIIPGLSAFVGGDIVAGIHASGMLTSEKPILLIDLGTNGELVLGNRDRLLACATAAGPAFEGGVNKGIWGADMVSLLAKLREEQLMDDTGLITEEYFDTGILIGNVCVTQQSVRAVQMAKAAIAAGIDILISGYGCRYEEIEKVILAGGFGYFLKPMDAAAIKLLPKELVKKTVSGGNTALAGAFQIGERLLKEAVMADIRRRENLQIEIINLAEEADFEKKYMDYMFF